MAPTNSALRWLNAASWLAIIVPAAMFAGAGWYLYEQAVSQAASEVDRASLVAQEHAQKVFETNVALINRVLDMIEDQSDGTVSARQKEIHDRLARMAGPLPQLQGVFVMSAAGRLLATDRVYPAPSGIDYTDREFYRHHRDGGAQPLITDVLTSRATGEPFFDLSMRRSNRDGTFGGIVSTSLRPEYFHRFYHDLVEEGSQLGIALVRKDGAVLASWPEPPRASDQPGGGTRWTMDVAAGTSRGRVPGGGDGLRAFHPVNAYPVNVLAWQPLDAVLAPWYEQMYLLAALMVPLMLALVIATQVARRRAWRMLLAYDQLREEVSRRQRAEGVLRQAQKLEAMGRLTGGVAHDFNNLLMVVQTNLHLLRRRHADRLAGSAELGAMERAMSSGTKLTRQLLSFSRSQPWHSQTIDLEAILPDVLVMIRTAIGSTVAVESKVEPGTGRINVDAAELELALLNVALNARDAMPGGGRLAVVARNASIADSAGLDGSFVAIELTDTGTGIDPAIAERVFEPFFTTKPAGQGTGLGLSQVYGFCTRSGGTTRIESKPGEGTTVRMLLPIAQAGGKAEASPSAAAQDRLDGVRLLLVEDNDDVAEATSAVLQSFGCRITHARSGDDGWAMVDRMPGEFDVVLSDIVMPGVLSGLDLAMKLAQSHPKLPVVLMSGYSKQASDATAAGFPIVAKPASPEVMVSAIGAALEKARGGVGAGN